MLVFARHSINRAGCVHAYVSNSLGYVFFSNNSKIVLYVTKTSQKLKAAKLWRDARYLALPVRCRCGARAMRLHQQLQSKHCSLVAVRQNDQRYTGRQIIQTVSTTCGALLLNISTTAAVHLQAVTRCCSMLSTIQTPLASVCRGLKPNFHPTMNG